MADYTELLIDNLKETFKAIERFLLLGFTASLILIVLAITDRELLGSQKVLFADINAPAVLVAVVSLGTYFAAGTFAAFYFATRRRIVKKLRESDPKILEALLKNENRVLPISSLMNDYHGIGDVCLSVPCIVNAKGVDAVLPIPLNEAEKAGLVNSAERIREVIRACGF